MNDEHKPDARCLDCGQPFETGRPSIGNLLRWRCSSCGGQLVVRIECNNCAQIVERETGVTGVYGRLAGPDTCDHCGEKVGLRNGLPGSFGPGLIDSSERRSLASVPLRRRLALVVIIQCSLNSFVGATVGLMVGGCLSGALYAGGVSVPEFLLGRTPLGIAPIDTVGFYALITLIAAAAFAAAGVWYGWRRIDAVVSETEPRLLKL